MIANISDINDYAKVVLPITSIKYTDANIVCEDRDGYYYWGIGPKPATCPNCPDEEDGDDSDPTLGPMDEFGNCRQLYPSDLLIRDDTQDDGTEPNPRHIFWNSPDIQLLDAETGDVITNMDTYSYSYCYLKVNVANIGINPLQGNERLHVFWSKPVLNSFHGHTLYPSHRITPVAGSHIYYWNQDTQAIAPYITSFNLPDNTQYAQELADAFSQKITVNWGFSILAVADDKNGELADFVNGEFPFDVWQNLAQQHKSIAVSSGNRLLFSNFNSNIFAVVPALNTPFSIRINQQPTMDRYVLSDFAEVNVLLSNDLMAKLDLQKSGVKKVNENAVLLPSADTELFFNPVTDENGLYFAGAEVHFISDKMPELNEFDFDMSLATDGELDQSMRITAVRDESVYFKAHAETATPRIVKTKENVTLTANQISPDAKYIWHNQAGDVIGEGEQITITPDVSQTYQIEVEEIDNGFKSYDEVDVIAVDGVIKSLASNPANDYVTVSYLLSDNVTDAVIQISDMYGNISASYPLLTTQTEKQIPLSGLMPGTYLVKLLISGTVVDSKQFLKQ